LWIGLASFFFLFSNSRKASVNAVEISRGAAVAEEAGSENAAMYDENLDEFIFCFVFTGLSVAGCFVSEVLARFACVGFTGVPPLELTGADGVVCSTAGWSCCLLL
jgi:hypothetical protein